MASLASRKSAGIGTTASRQHGQRPPREVRSSQALSLVRTEELTTPWCAALR